MSVIQYFLKVSVLVQKAKKSCYNVTILITKVLRTLAVFTGTCQTGFHRTHNTVLYSLGPDPLVVSGIKNFQQGELAKCPSWLASLRQMFFCIITHQGALFQAKCYTEFVERATPFICLCMHCMPIVNLFVIEHAYLCMSLEPCFRLSFINIRTIDEFFLAVPLRVIFLGCALIGITSIFPLTSTRLHLLEIWDRRSSGKLAYNFSHKKSF